VIDRAASSGIPIVFVIGGDPIASGLVTSLNHLGGNITGVSFASASLQPKRLVSQQRWARRTGHVAFRTFQICPKDVSPSLGAQLVSSSGDLAAEAKREKS
jgi:hypothetical protein